MARNLARAGYDLTVWNRSQAKAQALAAEVGCRVAATPKALAQACEVVVTMLADDAVSEQVHLGQDGLFGGETAKTFVEMGTMSPEHIADLAARAPNGAQIIDAPVSGATQAAESAQLLIMAGCTHENAEPVMALFEAMGKQTICLGKQGSGAVLKLAVNSLLHGINQAFAESMTLAEAAGIAIADAFDVIEKSAACAPMLKYRRPLYLDEANNDVTFTVALAHKDMAVTAQLASTLGVSAPQAAVTLQKLTEAEAAGYGQRDMASMLAFMRKEET